MREVRFIDWHWSRITKTAHALLRPVKRLLGESPRILDLGCGDGRQGVEIFDLFASPRIYGIDMDQNALCLCRDRFLGQGRSAKTVRGDAMNADLFLDGTFDLIHEYGMSELIADPIRLLHAAARLLRTGGYFLFQYGMEESSGAREFQSAMTKTGIATTYFIRRNPSEFQALVSRSGAPLRVVAQKAIWHYYRQSGWGQVVSGAGALPWELLDLWIRLKGYPPSGVYALIEKVHG